MICAIQCLDILMSMERTNEPLPGRYMNIVATFYNIRKVIPFIMSVSTTQSTWPSSITLVDIPREAPRKFLIGGGRMVGRIDGLSVAVGGCCIWGGLQTSKCVNATTLSEVRCQNTRCTLSCQGHWWRVTLVIMWCTCSAHDTGASVVWWVTFFHHGKCHHKWSPSCML